MRSRASRISQSSASNAGWVSSTCPPPLYHNRINDGVRASHRRVAWSVVRSIDCPSMPRDDETVDIKGKTAIIAGATSGLGLAVAH